MRSVSATIGLVVSCLLFKCTSKKCAQNTEEWITEAPYILEEFLLVKEEILSNKAFIDSFSRQGILFIGADIVDTSYFNQLKMPKLKEWFNKGRSMVSFSEKDTAAFYKYCNNGLHAAYAKVYKDSPIEPSTNPNVKLIDTLRLKGGWFAKVTECENCGS